LQGLTVDAFACAIFFIGVHITQLGVLNDASNATMCEKLLWVAFRLSNETSMRIKVSQKLKLLDGSYCRQQDNGIYMNDVATREREQDLVA
jgi:hypothetical protein